MLRRRLAWGLLGLEQPIGDLITTLQHFRYRWSQSQPPPRPNDWQKRCLASWREQPQVIGNDPVLDALISSLRMENGRSLAAWLGPTLFELARNRVAPEQVKAQLKYCWEQISQGVQRLRQGFPTWKGGQEAPGLGAFSAEGEATLRRILQALQPLQSHFQSPSAQYLEETGWRWAEALDEWDQVVHLCLCGLQPATSVLQWGLLLESLEWEPQLQAEGRQALCQWFQAWSCDLVYSLGPYQAQILGMEPVVEQLGLGLLRWQKLLPDWQREVAPCWSEFQQAIPEHCVETEKTLLFRWLEPEPPIRSDFVKRNPWRAWLKQAVQVPPRGALQQEARRLQQRLRLGRLFTTLVEPAFLCHSLAFPEQQWALDANDWLGVWLEGYEPLSEPVAALVEQRIGQVEQLLLRDFPVLDRKLSPYTV